MADRESLEANGSRSHNRRRSRSIARDHRSRRSRKDSRTRGSKRHRSRSVSEESYRRKHHKRHRRHERRDQKIDQIFDWMKASSAHRRRSRESSGSSRSTRKTSSRDRTPRSYSRSSTSHYRKEHEISFDSNSVKSVVIPVNRADKGDTQEQETVGPEKEVDPLTARLNALRAEGVPKPITGPAVSEDLCPILNMFLSKSEFAKTIKVCEKYPRPDNITHLTIPELPKDAEKIIDHKAVKNDDRFKNYQRCTVALFGLLSKSLDSVVKLREKAPELVEVGDMLLDGLQITGFLHQDFTTIRLKGMKQTVNPSYGDVVSQKPEEPEMLLGKTPIGEQMKSCDEINKLKAKFKKPESQTNSATRKDFHKGGEYKKRQFNRDFKPRNRKREDRRTRYYSPKGTYRKKQQDVQKQQEDNRNVTFRKT